MVFSALERLRAQHAREVLAAARQNGKDVLCPCCGAALRVETEREEVFVACARCLFAASSERCGG